MKLILENVRCFAGRHEIPIQPLTLLVGENSSGKTAFLAAASVALNRRHFPLATRFNDPPFSLGTYDTIATYKGGRGGRCREFALGWSDSDATLIARFVNVNGVPTPSTISATLNVLQDGPPVEVTVDCNGREAMVRSASTERKVLGLDPLGLGPRSLPGLLDRCLLEADIPGSYIPLPDGMLKPRWWEHSLFALEERPIRAIAPVRTQPRRTYDEFTEEFSPEGDHIPLVLATQQKEAQFVRDLRSFGEESGLFRDVSVKQLGRRPGDPMQVMIRVAGPSANLADVGYGVSQALPVVVEILRAPEPTLFLMQQPEVHLHPRAQAAFGSFLVQAVRSRHHHFVVETHSDYLVDRVRLEIARRHIDAAQVALLWFEKSGVETHVHRIHLDSLGSIVDPPQGYREFFLQEECALLTRSGLA